MEIEEYINLQHSLGTLESSGDFTVVPAEAMDKLSRFLLPDDAHALLKIIQGCVGWGASEIWVEPGKFDLTVYASHPGGREVIEKVSQHFEKIFLGMEDSPERDALLGLCHLLPRKPLYIGMSRWKERGLEAWATLHGAPPERIPRYPSGMQTGFGIHIALRPTAAPLEMPRHKWCKACFFCPLPIHCKGSVLGGRAEAPFDMPRAMLEYHRPGRDPLNGTLAPRWRGRSELDLGAELGWSNWENGKEAAVSHFRMIGTGEDGPPAGFRAKSSNIVEAVANLFQCTLPYCSGSLYLDREHRQESQTVSICAVKRGVVMEPVLVALPSPAACIFLACDSIPTDLTGSQVLEEAQAELVVRALELLKEGLQICCDNENQLPIDLNWREPTALAAVGGSVVLTITAAAVTGFLPVFWPGVFLTSYFALWLEKQFKGPKRLAELSVALHQDIAQLSSKLRSSGPSS